MKKVRNIGILFCISAFLLVVLTASVVNAASIEIKKTAIHDVVTLEETNIPAIYNLTIINSGSDDLFHIYTLLEAKMLPIINFQVPGLKETTILVTVRPLKQLKEKCGIGLCSLEYYLKGEIAGAIVDSINVKIMPLNETLRIDFPRVISQDASIFVFNITNRRNIDLGQVILNFDSEFSKIEENITIPADSSQKIELLLDVDALKAAEAGDYNVRLDFLIGGYNYVVEKNVNLQEYLNIVTTESYRLGFLGIKKIITRTNEGNAPQLVTIEITKNRFEQSFTSSNIKPTYEKQGIMGWQRELEPGESFTVEIKTDYTLPILFLIIVIIIILYFYFTKRPRLLVKKKAFRVKSSGGEFALKIVIHIRTIGHEAHGVVCHDRLPPISQVYKKWGLVRPDRIEGNRMTWNIGTLGPGSERVISYILYSKIKPIGTITIPRLSAVYIDHKNQRRTVYSNQLLILAEPEKKKKKEF